MKLNGRDVKLSTQYLTDLPVTLKLIQRLYTEIKVAGQLEMMGKVFLLLLLSFVYLDVAVHAKGELYFL